MPVCNPLVIKDLGKSPARRRKCLIVRHLRERRELRGNPEARVAGIVIGPVALEHTSLDEFANGRDHVAITDGVPDGFEFGLEFVAAHGFFVGTRGDGENEGAHGERIAHVLRSRRTNAIVILLEIRGDGQNDLDLLAGDTGEGVGDGEFGGLIHFIAI